MKIKINKNQNWGYPTLDTFPCGYFYKNDGSLVELTKKEISNSIKKNYNFGTVTSDGSLVETKNFLKRVMKLEKLNGAFIVECSNGEIELVIINHNENIYKSMFDNMNKSIVAGHKLYNASKDFKMRQAVGRDRVERFKIMANG